MTTRYRAEDGEGREIDIGVRREPFCVCRVSALHICTLLCTKQAVVFRPRAVFCLKNQTRAVQEGEKKTDTTAPGGMHNLVGTHTMRTNVAARALAFALPYLIPTFDF